MAEGLFELSECSPPGIEAAALRAAVVRLVPQTPLHMDLAPDRAAAQRLARNETRDDGAEHWFRYFTEEDKARCDDPTFALAMVNHEFCQVVRGGGSFPAQVLLEGGGTGCAIDRDGHVLTNYHLATGEIEHLDRQAGVRGREQRCRNLQAWMAVPAGATWRWQRADAVYLVANPPQGDALRPSADSRYRFRLHADVALLRIEPAPVAWLPLSVAQPRPGDPVWMAGYPLRTARGAAAYRDADGSLRISAGRVTAIGTGEEDGERFIVSDVDGAAGNSGSPLFDVQGRVIGVFSRVLEPDPRSLVTYVPMRRIHVPGAWAAAALGLAAGAG